MSNCHNIGHAITRYPLHELFFNINSGPHKDLGPVRLVSFLNTDAKPFRVHVHSEVHNVIVETSGDNLRLIETEASKQILTNIRKGLLYILAANFMELSNLVALGIFKDYILGSESITTEEGSQLQLELINYANYAAATGVREGVRHLAFALPVSNIDDEVKMAVPEYLDYMAKEEAKHAAAQPQASATATDELVTAFLASLLRNSGRRPGSR